MRFVVIPWVVALASLATPAAAADTPPALSLADAAVAMDAGDAARVGWSEDGESLVVSGPQWREPSTGLPRVSTESDDVVLQTADGDHRLTQGEDRFFDPVLSPDGAAVAFVGLVSGVHVIDVATRRVTHAGPGTAPTWTPDSSWVIFERTTDDGARLTGSELVAHRPADGQTLDLTATPETHERRPAVSPDGTRVAWLAGGSVWVARLVEVDR